MKMPCFLFKLRGSWKATQFYFRVSKRFFVSPMKLLPYFSLLSDCHSSLFCKESVILVFYSRLPQSYDQNTKLDKTLCSRVGSKKKRKYQFTFPSFSPFFFLFKKCSRRLLKSGDRNRIADSVCRGSLISVSCLWFHQSYDWNIKQYKLLV